MKLAALKCTDWCHVFSLSDLYCVLVGGAYDTQHHELIVKDWFLSGSEIIVSFFPPSTLRRSDTACQQRSTIFSFFFFFFHLSGRICIFFPEAHTLCVCFGEQGCVVPVRLNIHKVKANKQQQQQHKPQTKQNRDVTKEQTSCALPPRHGSIESTRQLHVLRWQACDTPRQEDVVCHCVA